MLHFQRDGSLLPRLVGGILQSFTGNLNILLIDLKTNAGGDVLVACGQGGRSDSEEGIEEDGF